MKDKLTSWSAYETIEYSNPYVPFNLSYKLHPILQNILNLPTNEFDPDNVDYHCPVCGSPLVAGAMNFICGAPLYSNGTCPKHFGISLSPYMIVDSYETYPKEEINYLGKISCGFKVADQMIWVDVDYAHNKINLRARYDQPQITIKDITYLPSELTQELIETLWLYS